MELLCLLYVLCTFSLIIAGFRVAFSLAGSAILFFTIGSVLGIIDPFTISLVPNRIFGIMTNNLLLAIPFFLLMGSILEKSGLAEDLLNSLGYLLRGIRGGLGLAVIIVGGLLAASTSIVAASVVSMGMISLPTMLKNNYSHEYATGVILASGTLGQIVPPSIVLIVLADQIGISVGAVFKGAIIPSLLLMTFYMGYTILTGFFQPKKISTAKSHFQPRTIKEIVTAVLPPLFLIVVVLGSILLGVATPSEAGSLGSIAAIIIAYNQIKCTKKVRGIIFQSAKYTVSLTGMILYLLIGATMFSLIFRSLNGDLYIASFLTNLPGGAIGFIIFSSLLIFILGFFIDFFEIVFIVVPLIIPIAVQFEIDLVWLCILISLNIQTSFLTPPFGFSLFFLRSVAPKKVKTKSIYKGVLPFVFIQLGTMVIIYFFPELITWNKL